MARVGAITRRARSTGQRRRTPASHYVTRAFTLDVLQRHLVVGGRSVRLTGRECHVLAILADRAGVAITRQELLHLAWEHNPRAEARAVDSIVTRLRRKLVKELATPRVIVTLRGMGYKLAL